VIAPVASTSTAGTSNGSVASRDGKSLFWQRWLPGSTPVAAVGIVHGAGEHGGRYPRLVAQLADRGHAVYALDLRGHGRSEGPRATVRRFSDYLDDVNAFVALLRRKHRGAPLFVAGYSLGGLVVASYALGDQDRLAGVVLAGPALGPGSGVSGVQMSLARSLSALVPRLRLLRLDPAAMLQAPAAIRSYRDDPLIYHGRFDARVLGEFATAIRRLQERADAVTLPVLVVHGADDRLADPIASRRLLAQCGSRDKTMRIYAGTRHDLFNEPLGDRVASDVATWIDAQRSKEAT
jgi:alpha-beta hydrolase superfamily lysophospholipase